MSERLSEPASRRESRQRDAADAGFSALPLQYAEPLRAAIEDYINAGFSVVPLPPRSKAAKIKGWQERTFMPGDFGPSFNVALRHDNGLCDVDLDWPEARTLAFDILPKSACYGRKSAWPSHVLYICKDVTKTVKFNLPAACSSDPRLANGEHAMTIAELRAGQSTMVPPSVHPSGEQLEWIEIDANDTVSADELRRFCGLLAFLSIVLRCYPGEGIRHEFGIVLSGALVRAGYGPDEAERLTRLAANQAGDEEAEARGDAKGAREKLDLGKEVTGLPRLCELLGLPAEMVQVFAKWLRQTAPPDGAIVLGNDREPENLEKMDAAFAASDLPHYQRLGRRVHVTRNANADEERPGALVIRECTRRVVQQDAQRIAGFVKYDGRSGAYVPAQCPDRLAEMYLCKSNGWSVHELRGVRESPTLRADGSILQTPGYDRATGFLYAPQLEYPAIPENPTRADAETAFRMLAHVVRDFAFASPADASVWGAAVLADATRPALEAAPVIGFDAPQFGAGKSLLANLACLIVHGTKLIGKGWTADEAENEKRLYAALLAGEHSYFADNIKMGLPFGGEAIAAILTQDRWAARKLGKSEQTPVSTRAIFYATGVNLTFTADVVRRALKCRIEPGVDHPENRPFDYDIAAETLANHPRLLAAALTIVRAYVVAGFPMQGKFTPMGSFGDFDRLIRGALLWLGLADPLETQRDIESVDPEIDTLSRGLELLEAVFGERAFQVKDIAASTGKVKSDAQTALLDWVRDTTPPARDAGVINTKALGHYLKSKRGTPRDGRKLTIVMAGTAQANGKLGRDGTIWRLVRSRCESSEPFENCQERATSNCQRHNRH
jgi:hypothetical protein